MQFTIVAYVRFKLILGIRTVPVDPPGSNANSDFNVLINFNEDFRYFSNMHSLLLIVLFSCFRLSRVHAEVDLRSNLYHWWRKIKEIEISVSHSLFLRFGLWTIAIAIATIIIAVHKKSKNLTQLQTHYKFDNQI